MKKSTLLFIDSIINLVLGVLLFFYPPSLAIFLGLPVVELAFYPTILGAVLFGIGLALLIERFGSQKGFHGLGLEGAIAINLCGGFGLAVWLFFGGLVIPLSGYIFLWGLVVLLVGISLFEIFAVWNRLETP